MFHDFSCLVYRYIVCLIEKFMKIRNWCYFLKNLNPLAILSMEKTMIAMVISELKSVFSRLKIYPENWPFVLSF